MAAVMPHDQKIFGYKKKVRKAEEVKKEREKYHEDLCHFGTYGERGKC